MQYYALFKDHDDDARAINEALKQVAGMLGCMMYIESTSRLMVVGEEMAVGTCGRQPSKPTRRH